MLQISLFLFADGQAISRKKEEKRYSNICKTPRQVLDLCRIRLWYMNQYDNDAAHSLQRCSPFHTEYMFTIPWTDAQENATTNTPSNAFSVNISSTIVHYLTALSTSFLSMFGLHTVHSSTKSVSSHTASYNCSIFYRTVSDYSIGIQLPPKVHFCL